MTAVTWDETGERTYQTGVDRGMLYPQTGDGVPWNGLIGVEESPSQDLKSFYLDGAKFLQNLTPGDFQGKLKAYTYPDEFEPMLGISSPGLDSPGFSLYEQMPQSFCLSYRTKVGNDVDGMDHGYKIHILYDLLADPESYTYETLNESVQPMEFSWGLTGTPRTLVGSRPSAHVTIDSRTISEELLAEIEGILYGTEGSDPRVVDIGEIAVIFGFVGGLVITDHGDGTWSARDTGGDYITMTDDTTFSIDGAITTVVDADTYTIASTPAP